MTGKRSIILNRIINNLKRIKIATAEAKKNRQQLEIEKKTKNEIMRISTEAAMKAELVKVMHDEALKKTQEQIRILEEKQENYLKIIQKKNYEATYPKPLLLKNHQIENPKAFYIQILGCRGSGKSTFLNRFFQRTELRKYLKYFYFLF